MNKCVKCYKPCKNVFCSSECAKIPWQERFWLYVDKGNTEVCWEWKGVKEGKKWSYGKFKLNGKICGAHRVSWELANGPIPDGLFVCHKCDNPPCVNPAHLFLGTHKENINDAKNKGKMVGPGPRSGWITKRTKEKILRGEINIFKWLMPLPKKEEKPPKEVKVVLYCKACNDVIKTGLLCNHDFCKRLNSKTRKKYE